jgi:hypothetical protein
MKCVVFSLVAMLGVGSQALCCERVVSRAAVVVSEPAVALAVPLVAANHFGTSTHVFAAPVVNPLIVVERPLFVPRVSVFAPRRSLRVFVR